MKITLNLSPRWEPLLHHCLKITTLLYTAFFVLHDISDIHWSIAVAAWTACAVGLVAAAFALAHMRADGECDVCRRKPPADLKRWHNRLRAAYAHHGVYLLAVAFILWLIATGLTNGKGAPLKRYKLEGGSPELNWLDVSAQLTIIYLFLAWISAATFLRHHTGKPGPGALTRYLRSSGKHLTHKAHWVNGTFCALLAVLAFVPRDNFIVPIIGTIFSLGLFAAVILGQEHSMTLCEDCVTEFRTDAPEHAERHTIRFKIAHRSGWVLGAAALAMLATLLWRDNLITSLIVATFYVLAFLGALVWRFHSSYQPWCPLCRGGGGDDDEEELAPEPTGGHGRPVPVA